MSKLPTEENHALLVGMTNHQRGCEVCRAFDRPGGADRSKDGLPACRVYRRLYAAYLKSLLFSSITT